MLFALLATSFIISASTADVTISFSPLNLDPETLLVYNSTGTLIGVYNTSEKAMTLNDSQSYSIIIQPSSSDLLVNHPETWFNNFLAYVGAHLIGLIVIVFLASILIAAYKRW